MDIDKDKLRELAATAANSSGDISEGLGLGAPHNLHYHLNRNPELKQIFEEARASVGKLRAKPGTKKTARNQQSATGKRKSGDTPPRNGNAKASQKELFKKLLLEFEHIDVYGAVSEHFDELREEISKQ